MTLERLYRKKNVLDNLAASYCFDCGASYFSFGIRYITIQFVEDEYLSIQIKDDSCVFSRGSDWPAPFPIDRAIARLEQFTFHNIYNGAYINFWMQQLREEVLNYVS